MTVGGPLTCTETPNFNFDPADEYYGQGFSYGPPAGAGSGGSGRAAPAAPPNHYVGGGPAALLGAGRLLTPAQPLLEAYGMLATAPFFGEEQGAILLARQLASEELLSQAVRGLGVPIVRGEAIRDVPRFVALYGGEAADWVKMTTGARTAGGIQTAIHWYRNVALGLNLEFKTNLLSRGWWWP